MKENISSIIINIIIIIRKTHKTGGVKIWDVKLLDITTIYILFFVVVIIIKLNKSFNYNYICINL